MNTCKKYALGGLCLFMLQCSDDGSDAPAIAHLPHAVYVADEHGQTITVIDAATDSVAGKIAIGVPGGHHGQGLIPHNVQVAPNGKTVWLTASTHDHGVAEQVMVIDPHSGHRIIAKITLGTDQHLAHVVLDSASHFAYVAANQPGEVVEIDAATFKITRRIPLGNDRGPHGLRYHNGTLYVANLAGKSLGIVDLATGSVEELALGGAAVQTAVVPGGQYIFVSLYDTKEVVRYEPSTRKLDRLALPPGAQGPIQLYPTPDGKWIYVCDQGGLDGDPVSDKVYAIDVQSFSVSHEITCGTAAHGVVVSQDGKRAYVTNSGENTLTIVDVATQKPVKTLPVGESPNGVSFMFPGGGMP
ncbi:MAG: hypothetical protein IT266_02860 [Saprospiraceae bacterium]|nr:hypothetical protein [Saprospiraceae bacterium]